MTQLQTIEQQIADKKKELESVKGTECEVWTRIVGYYRPVDQWNAGKTAELKERKKYHA